MQSYRKKYRKYFKRKLNLKPYKKIKNKAPYFRDYIISQAEKFVKTK